MLNCVPEKYKKWLALLGSLLINLANGFYFTFGNMSPYIISYLREMDGLDVRYSDSIWILTANNLSLKLAALLTGLISSRFKFSVKYFIFLGCCLFSSGVALTYFTIQKSFYLTLFTYGIVNGCGFGLNHLSQLSIIMKWFPKSKGIASSAVLFGIGAGSIIFDEIQTQYINPNNYPPDKPYSSLTPNEKYFSKLHIDLLERIPKSMLILTIVFVSFQIIGFLILFEKTDDLSNEQTINNTTINSISSSSGYEELSVKIDEVEFIEKAEVNSLGVKYELENEGLGLGQVLKIPSFYLILIMAGFIAVGPGFLQSYYKTFGLSFIHDDKFLATLGSVSSIFNAFGRPFFGFLFDRTSFKLCFLIINTTIIALMSTLYLTSLASIGKELYLIWISGITFAFAGFPVIFASNTARCFGQKNFMLIYGVVFLLDLPFLILITFLGRLNEEIGWFWFFIMGCAFSIVGSLAGFMFNVKKSNKKDI